MDTPHKLASEPEADRIVYVRSVETKDLPDEVREEAGDLTELFAVHAANGDRLALVSNRDLAFEIARQNDFMPFPVH